MKGSYPRAGEVWRRKATGALVDVVRVGPYGVGQFAEERVYWENLVDGRGMAVLVEHFRNSYEKVE